MARIPLRRHLGQPFARIVIGRRQVVLGIKPKGRRRVVPRVKVKAGKQKDQKDGPRAPMSFRSRFLGGSAALDISIVPVGQTTSSWPMRQYSHRPSCGLGHGSNRGIYASFSWRSAFLRPLPAELNPLRSPPL